MAHYIIEFRFHAYTNKYAERLIYEVARKFRIKEITRKKAVPHITLFGPFTTSYEKKMVSEVINIAEKYGYEVHYNKDNLSHMWCEKKE